MWPSETHVKQPSITDDRSRMDDLQRKVSSPDRYIIRRNGDLDLDPMVRRIRDLTMFGSLHERERTIPRLPLFGEWLQSQASD